MAGNPKRKKEEQGKENRENEKISPLDRSEGDLQFAGNPFHFVLKHRKMRPPFDGLILEQFLSSYIREWWFGIE